MKSTAALIFSALLFFALIFESSQLEAKTFRTAEVSWLARASEAGITAFHVCGTADILASRKSLNKDFLSGPNKTGYLLVGLFNYGKYRQIVEEKTQKDAATALQEEFSKTHLWSYSEANGFVDLGAPTSFNPFFKRTIKDCINGAKSNVGADCSQFEGSDKRSCCSEKFSGPVVAWGTKGEYRLSYSPDPSVRVKVAGEAKNRFCNVSDRISIEK